MITEINEPSSAQYLDHFSWLPSSDNIEGYYECCPLFASGRSLHDDALSGVLCESLFTAATCSLVS